MMIMIMILPVKLQADHVRSSFKRKAQCYSLSLYYSLYEAAFSILARESKHVTERRTTRTYISSARTLSGVSISESTAKTKTF